MAKAGRPGIVKAKYKCNEIHINRQPVWICPYRQSKSVIYVLELRLNMVFVNRARAGSLGPKFRKSLRT